MGKVSTSLNGSNITSITFICVDCIKRITCVFPFPVMYYLTRLILYLKIPYTFSLFLNNHVLFLWKHPLHVLYACLYRQHQLLKNAEDFAGRWHQAYRQNNIWILIKLLLIFFIFLKEMWVILLFSVCTYFS